MQRVRRAGIAALVLIVVSASGGPPMVGRSMAPAVVRAAAVAWPVSSLVVAEVQTGGLSASDEFVEIANQGAGPVDLNGLEVVYVTSSGSTVTRKATWAESLILEPGRRTLLVNGAGALAALGDSVYTGGFAATGGAVALRVVGGATIDAIGWGDATNPFVEGTAAPAPAAGWSLERRPGGALGNDVDTNDNVVDWSLTDSPSPQGLSAPPVPEPAPTASPIPTATTTPTTEPTATLDPTSDPTAPPDPTDTPAPTAAPTPTPAPTPAPSASPAPTPGPTPTPAPTPTPTASPVAISIAAARGLAIGSTTTVRGVVTAEAGRLGSPPLLAIADDTGGIVVKLPDGASTPARGQRVTVRGALADPYGQIELRPAASGWTVDGVGPLPDPIELATGGPDESTEGRLVRTTGVVVIKPTKATSGDLSTTIETSAGTRIRIMSDASSGLATTSLQLGARYRLTGIAGQRASKKGALDGYRIWLRDIADVTLIAAAPSTPAPSGGAGSTHKPTDPKPSSTVVAIASALRTTDRDVSIDAVVTAGASLLDSTGRRIVVQDATGAVEVYVPKDGRAPGIGTRVVVTGRVGTAYGAPRLRATTVTGRGPGTVPAALRVHGALSAVHAWRLVSISGRLDDVRKLGERWRAEVVVGSQRLVVVGQPGAGIPISMLIEGRAIDVVGIVRPANPSSSDQRSNLLPRSTADVRIAGAAPGSGPSSRGSTASGSAGGTLPGAGRATAGDPTEAATAGAVPDRNLVDLEAHIGETIRVGGIVVDLRPTGFSLDDGTAIGAIDLEGAAADLRALVEPGDAINVVGRVEPRAGEPVVVVDEPALVHLASAPGGTSAAPVDVDPVSSTADRGPDTAPSATVAGFGSDVAGLPGAGFGLMGLLGVALLSAVATVLRRWHAQRLLAIRIAARLAALAGAPPPAASRPDAPTRPTTTP